MVTLVVFQVSNHFILCKLGLPARTQFRFFVIERSQFVTSISSRGDHQAPHDRHNQVVKFSGIFRPLIDIYFNDGVHENIHEIPVIWLKSHQSSIILSR